MFVIVCHRDSGLVNDSKFFEVHVYLGIKVGALCFEALDFGHHCLDVNFFLLFECIDVARDIEVVIVVLDFLERGAVAVFLNLGAVAVCVDYLLNMLRTQFVLGLDLLELLAGIYEEDVVAFLAAFLHHEDAGRDAGAVEDVGRKSDYRVNVVLLLNEELTDLAFSCST